MSGPFTLVARPRPSGIDRQIERLKQLDGLSRARPLNDTESRELERLLHADYCRRLRTDRPIPRGIA